SPAWIENGQKVAFLTDITGTPQVWAVDANGGWPDQLTFFTEKVWTLSAAPDGLSLFCSRDIGGNELYQMFLVDSKGVEVMRISRDMNAIYDFGAWSQDGNRIAFSSNQRDGIHFDVYVQDIDNGKPEMVYQSTGMFDVLTWSPNGSHLILLEYISSAQMPLYTLNITTREIKPLTPLDEPINNLTAKWTKDGTIYLLTNHNRDNLEVATLDYATGEIKYLFEDNKWDIEDLAASQDGRTLAYIANQDGYKRLFVHDQDTCQ
ncbi:MAG: TolB family protein, partial [Anaerolineales bacterium]